MPLITASILSVSIGDVKVQQMRHSKNYTQLVRAPFLHSPCCWLEILLGNISNQMSDLEKKNSLNFNLG